MTIDIHSNHAATNDLRVLVEDVLSAEYGPSAVQTLERTAFAMSSSYPAEVITVRLVDGRTLNILLKNFSRCHRRAFRDLPERRSREIAVYRDLLAEADLGTARYYGSVEDPARHRFWLLLEHVEGTQVRYESFDMWLPAATWLGRMQAYVAAHPNILSRCPLVRPLTTDFFLATADAAERETAAYGPEIAARLARALRGYPELAARMAARPPTLVHGSYRPQNIVLGRAGGTLRVCPVDWETTLLGPPEFDLAYLVEGFDDRRRRVLIEAYREAASQGMQVHGDNEADVLIYGCEIHKNLRSLSHAVGKNIPLVRVSKLVGMVEAAAARALRGRPDRAPRSRSTK